MSGVSLSALEEEILVLLSGEKTYGKKIIEKIAELSNGDRIGFQGTFYPIFKKLESQKYVVATWGDSDLGARRKYYEITQQGLEALNQKEEYRSRLRQWSKK